jgi:hypothetical protein
MTRIEATTEVAITTDSSILSSLSLDDKLRLPIMGPANGYDRLASVRHFRSIVVSPRRTIAYVQDS